MLSHLLPCHLLYNPQHRHTCKSEVAHCEFAGQVGHMCPSCQHGTGEVLLPFLFELSFDECKYIRRHFLLVLCFITEPGVEFLRRIDEERQMVNGRVLFLFYKNDQQEDGPLL